MTFCAPVCYSLGLWAVCWLPPPPLLPQQQLEVVKGCQGWCPSLQGSLCPQSPPSRQHLDLAKRQQIQNLHSRTLAHTRSATANVKVRRVSLYDWCWFFIFTQLLRYLSCPCNRWVADVLTVLCVSEVFPLQMEGVRLVVNKGLSNHFQVSHTITLSTLGESGYRFGSTYVGSKQTGPAEVIIYSTLRHICQFFPLHD